ncbi:hypothetical protein C4K38_6358 [Pseudomonas chlororaphis subsp. piscium]|nr:hypothetical protein C4K38_6358 [Pseudomonas chlororaphis subsp. piscium]SDS03455.1 hypothetical protein SAMN05216585_1021 [Pseudomonas chlororaphis]
MPAIAAPSTGGKVLRLLNAFLCSVGVLTILVLFALLFTWQRDTPPKLFAHPNALWVGAEDGGVFVEIAKAEAPDYYVEIRHENGDIWAEGWIRYDSKDGFPLSAAAITGFGGEALYLQTSVAMTPEKAEGR